MVDTKTTSGLWSRIYQVSGRRQVSTGVEPAFWRQKAERTGWLGRSAMSTRSWPFSGLRRPRPARTRALWQRDQTIRGTCPPGGMERQLLRELAPAVTAVRVLYGVNLVSTSRGTAGHTHAPTVHGHPFSKAGPSPSSEQASRAANLHASQQTRMSLGYLHEQGLGPVPKHLCTPNFSTRTHMPL